MTQAVATHEQYEADFRKLQDDRSADPDWLKELRNAAFTRFQELGFPVERKGNEPWKYTDVRALAAETFSYETAGATSVDPARLFPFDDGMSRVAFVNGRFSKELSMPPPDGVVVMPLAQAIKEHGEGVRRHLAQHAGFADEAFTALNTAFVSDGAFVLAEGAVAKPLHIVYVTTERAVTHPRTLIVGRPTSELSVVESYFSATEGAHFTNAVTEVALDEGAQVTHRRLLLENHEANHIASTRVHQSRDSAYRSLVYETGGGLVRNDLTVLLDAEGTEVDLKGLYVTAGKQHVDNNINIDHAKPHGYSRLYYKGILDEQSRAVFGGMVMVRQGADKTDAHQEDKNLILSHEAEVDSKPALEIYADDVKAGHGATAGAIADEALFYMQSRGIDAERAMLFLVRGFASEILDSVTIEPLRRWLEERTTQALPRFREVQ
ncbi:MAG TPA: Fe-S cluster assembly protein SufD [Dehalococcoidia bacterium]